MTARENFPVGSILIRADLRPAVAAFYAFARTADDLADDPLTASRAKLAALDRHEAGLDGDPTGAPEGLALRAVLLARGRSLGLDHARRLLAAFRRDARGGAVATWPDLLDYCAQSAEPVGRFLLDLHGEGSAAAAASDRLCAALQVLNHLQDLKADHLRLGRLYMPGDWMEAEGAGAADLAADRMTPALRRVADRALDRCDAMLAEAAGLPEALASRRLGAEAATILRLAQALSGRLRRGDPIAGRVSLSRLDMARAGALGAWRLVSPRRPPEGLARGRA